MNKTEIISYLRQNGFNCFPIPAGLKAADYRYKGSNTIPNQEIKESDNYGVIPIQGAGTCILDCDDKERFREFAQKFINNGNLVIESPHGWHIYASNVSGMISKIELFDYEIQDKKILEIQGPDHYCVGPLSIVDGNEYVLNQGNLWNVNADFHELTDRCCTKLNLTGRKKDSSSSYKYLRDRFSEDLPPREGQSNDYFMQAALVCNTEGLSREDAITRITKVYNYWQKTTSYSGRPWSNIEAKINEVYDNNLTVKHGGNRKSDSESEEKLADRILEEKKLFSDKNTRLLYKTDNGFLEEITESFQSYLTKEFHTGRTKTAEVMHFLIGKADNLPDTNSNIIRFKNGVFDTKANIFNPSDDSTVCLIGYPNYEYKETANPERFISLIENQIEDSSKSNFKAWLSKVPTAQKEIRMAVLYGIPGCGKSALASTIQLSLGQNFAYGVTMKDFFGDRATQAKMIGKTMLYFQDTPKEWDDIDRLKQTTGEIYLSVREMYKDSEMMRNMLNIVMSTNNLPKIESEDADAMFDRLTLVQFKNVKIRGSATDDEEFPISVAEAEGEDIISYCLNLRKEKHSLKSSSETKSEWTNISCPEIGLFNKYFEYKKGEDGFSPIEIKRYIEHCANVDIDMDVIKKYLKSEGYSMLQGNYKDMIHREMPKESLDKFG